MEKKPTKAAIAAKEIRQLLKQAWPSVRFRVRCSNFSMGDAVDVKWTDGPSSKQVDNVVQAWQSEDFDGMTDSSVARPDTIVDGTILCNRVRFVHTTRHFSRDFMRQVALDLCDRYELPLPVFDDNGNVIGDYKLPDGRFFGCRNHYISHLLWQHAAERGMPPSGPLPAWAILTQEYIDQETEKLVSGL